MAQMSKTKYSYETKLAAAKAYVEDQIPHLDIMAKYGVTPKLLRRCCKIYSEHGEVGLQPKKIGRPGEAKQKPAQELTPIEKIPKACPILHSDMKWRIRPEFDGPRNTTSHEASLAWTTQGWL